MFGLTDFEVKVTAAIVEAGSFSPPEFDIAYGRRARYGICIDARDRCADLRIGSRYAIVHIEVYKTVFDYGRNKAHLYAHPQFQKHVGFMARGEKSEHLIPLCRTVILLCDDELAQNNTARAKNTRREFQLTFGGHAFCFGHEVLPNEIDAVAKQVKSLLYPYHEEV